MFTMHMLLIYGLLASVVTTSDVLQIDEEEIEEDHCIYDIYSYDDI